MPDNATLHFRPHLLLTTTVLLPLQRCEKLSDNHLFKQFFLRTQENICYTFKVLWLKTGSRLRDFNGHERSFESFAAPGAPRQRPKKLQGRWIRVISLLYDAFIWLDPYLKFCIQQKVARHSLSVCTKD